jgi:formylglycine-generating enzyme required for sulfatase activity
MRCFVHKIRLWLLLGGILFSAVTFAQGTMAGEKKIALVIGNAAYRTAPLKNPGNDARAIAEKLKSLGFEVISRENLATRQISTTLREFRSRLTPGSVALFFYAGHGMQVKGNNYLPTIDADIVSEEDAPLNSINLNQILDIMDEAKTRLNLVFLDACRNNPFTRRFRSALGGLARVDAPSGTLISFATRPGSVAADGEGDHGLYTQHLLAQIEVPNQPIEQSLKRIVAGVKKDSNGQQEPWMEGSLDGDFYFMGGPQAVAANDAPPLPLTGAGISATFELTFWDSIRNSANPDDFRAYLQQYPEGRFGPLATSRLRQLAPVQPAAAPVLNSRDNIDGRKVFRDCPECPEMVVIPPGKFQMGAPIRESGSGDAERPRHEVHIPEPIAVGRFEITRRQYAAFIAASHHKVEGSCFVWVSSEWVNQAGRNWRDPDYAQNDDHPAVCVSWQDAKAYVAWLSMKTGQPYRLLSEAEWEYAARAGTRTSRYWGDDPELACEFANVHDSVTQQMRRFEWEPHGCKDGFVETAPVGSFKPNPFGLHDMLGNVWEWVEDCQTVNYIGAPKDGSARVADDCVRRVYRGGGWSGPASVRAAVRNGNPPSYRSQLLGFRVSRPVSADFAGASPQ